MNDLSQEGIG